MAAQPVLLEECSYDEVTRLVKGGMDMVILPTGAVEQHSLHMSINVDAVVADEIARAVSARTGVPMLPTLPYGHSSNHRGFPGTFSIKPETYMKVMEDLADWVWASGFRRLVFLNANLPNQYPLQCAIANIFMKYPEMYLRSLNWWEATPEIRAAVTADESFGRIHANSAETSIMMYLRPHLVDLSKTYMMPGRGQRLFFHYPHICVSHTGHQGDPRRATPEEGKRIIDMVVNAVSEQIKAGLKETFPDLAKFPRNGG